MYTVRAMILLVAVLFGVAANASVPPLTVEGNRILSGGEAKSFAGSSLFWSNNDWGGERYYTAGTVNWLKSDWNATLVRAAMGVEDPGGYLDDPEANRARVLTVVDAAIANDMYVIIDWHSHHAERHRPEAIAFFQDMARRYGNYNNVIYEIYNEPLQVSWSNTIKPYAEAVIAAIREIDANNLIVVGTPNWSQDVDVASRDPIRGYNNIAYALHFYAGTHGESLRNKARTALNNGVALMATEWGTVNADGDGAVARAATDTWMNFLKQNHISHANWALNDKAEGASALYPGASANGGWSDADLTDSGAYVKNIIANWGTTTGGGGTSSSSSSSISSSSSSSSSSHSSSSSVVVVGQQCNWYGSIIPVCAHQQTGWGYENGASCVSAQTCTSQSGDGGLVGSSSSSSQSSSSSSSSSVSSSTSSSSSSSASSEPAGSGSCANEVAGGNSGNFGTTGAYCFRTQDNISGWGASNFTNRTVSVTVNGSGPAVTTLGANLPSKGANDYYHFEISAGDFSWASIYWW